MQRCQVGGLSRTGPLIHFKSRATSLSGSSEAAPAAAEGTDIFLPAPSRQAATRASPATKATFAGGECPGVPLWQQVTGHKGGRAAGARSHRAGRRRGGQGAGPGATLSSAPLGTRAPAELGGVGEPSWERG